MVSAAAFLILLAPAAEVVQYNADLWLRNGSRI